MILLLISPPLVLLRRQNHPDNYQMVFAHMKMRKYL